MIKTKQSFSLAGEYSLEAEYHEAIATNIVHELLHRQRSERSDTEQRSSSDEDPINMTSPDSSDTKKIIPTKVNVKDKVSDCRYYILNIMTICLRLSLLIRPAG